MKSRKIFPHLLKAIFFIFLIVCMDYFFGGLCRKYYFKQTKGEIFKENYSIDSVKTDVLIFGSSRASHHYIPDTIEKHLSLSCYNAGIDGYFILYHYALLKCVTKRYTPKLIILDLTPGDLLESPGTYDGLDVLLPYYKTHEEIRSLVNLRKFEKIKMLSQIYPFNHCLDKFGKINKLDIKSRLLTKGYTPETIVWNEKRRIKEPQYNFVYDVNKVAAFKDFMDICNSKGIELVVTISPYYLDMNEESKELIKEVRTMTSKRNVPLFDYSQDTTFINHAGLFRDRMHLDNSGAEIYSDQVSHKIIHYDLETKHRLFL